MSLLGSSSSKRSRSSDAAVMRTADDAVLSKLSAAAMGYYDDPFLSHFAGGANGLTGRPSDMTSAGAGGLPLPAHAEGGATGVGPGPRWPSAAAGGGGRPSSDGRAHPYNRTLSSPLPSQPRQYQPPAVTTATTMTTTTTQPSRGPVAAHRPFSGCPPSAIHPALRGHCCGGCAPPPTRGAGGQPLMRRGTHARVCVVDRALTAFLSADTGRGAKQVVVLGAGRDTSYLRYVYGLLMSGPGDKDDDGAVGTDHEVRWYEVDHPDVTKNKRDLLLSCPLIETTETAVLDNGCDGPSVVLSISAKEETGDVGNGPGTNAAPRPGHRSRSASSALHLIPFDLRHPPRDLLALLSSGTHRFDPSAPALFVLECVMMYLPDDSSRTLLRELSGACAQAAAAVYDPILGERGDPFGRVMEANLARAGVGSGGGGGKAGTCGGGGGDLSLTACRTLRSQVDKLAECWRSADGGGGGGAVAIASDMLSAYESVVPPSQRDRANGAEMLDEIEEWVLIMRHYCFAAATNGGRGGGDAPWLQTFAAVGKDSALGFVEGRCEVRRTP